MSRIGEINRYGISQGIKPLKRDKNALYLNRPVYKPKGAVSTFIKLNADKFNPFKIALKLFGATIDGTCGAIKTAAKHLNALMYLK